MYSLHWQRRRMGGAEGGPPPARARMGDSVSRGKQALLACAHYVAQLPLGQIRSIPRGSSRFRGVGGGARLLPAAGYTLRCSRCRCQALDDYDTFIGEFAALKSHVMRLPASFQASVHRYFANGTPWRWHVRSRAALARVDTCFPTGGFGGALGGHLCILSCVCACTLR